MQQNYKRLAAAAVAAMFVGSIFDETSGTILSDARPNQSAIAKQATLSNGQVINYNANDAESVFNAFKCALEIQDFPSARGLLQLVPFESPQSIKSRISECKAANYSSPEYQASVLADLTIQLRFSEKRNEFYDEIISAIEKYPLARILEDRLSKERWILMVLDSTDETNYVQQYNKCLDIQAMPRGSESLSMSSILERVDPKTEYGRRLKADLLREYSFYK